MRTAAFSDRKTRETRHASRIRGDRRGKSANRHAATENSAQHTIFPAHHTLRGVGRGGTGRGNGKILNGHIFVNTHQNCTKFSVVVYCVDIEFITCKKSTKSHYACNKKVSNNLKINPKCSLRPIEYREQLLKI